MNFDQVAQEMSVEVYQRIKTAVETGRWPDGRVLSERQKHISLQAILQYQHAHLPPQQRSGYIPAKNQSACYSREQHSSDQHSSDEEQPLHWQE